ncbi:hypothetical protein HWV62_38628 [Athelia sp. TMB]|nr:hypothetical protein HWV62_38628 [Athelia sp. TMB]
MWCTRWFLPLLLLPIPTAPPYFLLLFLFSLTMHARPCFYCIVLLAALFISSCYWQPLPISSPLSVPWSQNITTFSEALNGSISGADFTLPPTANDEKPPIIKLMDRCWCDFTSGSLFEPFNVTRWEFASVTRLKQEIEKEKLQAKATVDTTAQAQGPSGSTDVPAPTPSPTQVAAATGAPRKGALESLRSVFWRTPPQVPEEPDEPETFSAVHEAQEEKRTSRPGELDLEPYGFDLVLDFGWTRQAS